jgi:hypothetical protein
MLDLTKVRHKSQEIAQSGCRRSRQLHYFCVQLVGDERQITGHAVGFEAPHESKVAEPVARFHEMDLGCDVINQEGNTFIV